jgi:hypothetical protein
VFGVIAPVVGFNDKPFGTELNVPVKLAELPPVKLTPQILSVEQFCGE